VVSHSKKRKKSCFWILKKNVHSFTGHLITQLLITQILYRNAVPVSHGHQHQTSCLEVWTQESMQLRSVCDKRLYVPITSGSFEAKISIDIQQTFFFFVTMLASLRTKFLLPSDRLFTFFFQSHFKKRKVMFFLKSEKTKNTYSRTLQQQPGVEKCPDGPLTFK